MHAVVSDGDEDYSVKGNDQDDIDDDEDLIVDEDEGMPSTSRRKAPASRAKQPAKSKVVRTLVCCNCTLI
eukprot:scaffold187273_cov17-Tisochrysis_lutea.AAC.1